MTYALEPMELSLDDLDTAAGGSSAQDWIIGTGFVAGGTAFGTIVGGSFAGGSAGAAGGPFGMIIGGMVGAVVGGASYWYAFYGPSSWGGGFANTQTALN